MKTKIATALFAFAAASLFAQGTPGPSDDQGKITKIIRVRGNAAWLGSIAQTPGGASVRINDNLHAVVANGSPTAVAEIERIIHDLDTNAEAEKKDVELTFYLVSGSPETPPTTAESENPALVPVYRQLRGIFPLKTYRLVNTMFLRFKEAQEPFQPQIHGMLQELNGSGTPGAYAPGTYRIICNASADASSIIHVTRLSLDVQIPVVTTSTNSAGASPTTSVQRMSLGVDTRLDLREGQKVVVGTSNVEPGQITLFLILSAHILP
jgi:hypothetical protein